MDDCERVWIDYVMPVVGIAISVNTVFRRRERDPITLFFTIVLAAGSILMGLNTVAKLGLL
jgi:hypothetical protein